MNRNIEQNLFQVINELHFDEILENNIQNMTIVMLGSKECGPCKIIKPKFVDLSKQHKDILFIYIDRANYQLGNNKYFNEFAYTPTFVFYFGGHKIAFVEGAHEPSLLSAINVLKQKIDQKRKEIEQKEKLLEDQKRSELEALNLLEKMQNQQPSQQPLQQPQVTEELILLNKKMEILQQLRNMSNAGVKLTKNYNLDSTLEELLTEYNLQINSQQQSQQLQQPQQPQQSQQPDHNAELLKKQEQVKQIKELDLLNQKMQAQSFQKLQQLRKLQQLKEEQEKNNEKH